MCALDGAAALRRLLRKHLELPLAAGRERALALGPRRGGHQRRHRATQGTLQSDATHPGLLSTAKYHCATVAKFPCPCSPLLLFNSNLQRQVAVPLLANICETA